MSAAFDRLPSFLSTTSTMKRRSNSRRASSYWMPFSTICVTSCSSSLCTLVRHSLGKGGRVQLPAGQPAEGVEILRARVFDDVRWQRGDGRLLVPVDRLEVVAHVLLVEAWLRAAGRIGVLWPVA